MEFKSEKTGEYLRSEVLVKGVQERRRAMHALSHQYGTGSRAALATLILASLGGESAEQNPIDLRPAEKLETLHSSVIEQISVPMQHGANDSDYNRKLAV